MLGFGRSSFASGKGTEELGIPSGAPSPKKAPWRGPGHPAYGGALRLPDACVAAIRCRAAGSNGQYDGTVE